MTKIRELEWPLGARAIADRRPCHVRRERPGWGPKFCGKASAYQIDGLFYCEAHAGMVALAILLKEGEG